MPCRYGNMRAVADDVQCERVARYVARSPDYTDVVEVCVVHVRAWRRWYPDDTITSLRVPTRE